MAFRTLAASLVTLLGDNAAGRYRTIGYQTRSQTADEIIDSDRSVQVYYSTGDMPKSAGALQGPVMHDMDFKIEITVAKAAEGDLATIDNPASTPAQLQVAIAAIKTAEFLANQSFDEVADILWQILMDAQNQGLGLDQNLVGSRWCGRIVKDPIVRHGELAVLTGGIDLNAIMEETVTGDTPQPLVIIETDFEINGSTEKLAGTENTDFTP
jgi:hypothetical protein